MMKMALPIAAIGAPFMFPGLGAAMGLGAAAAGPTMAGGGAMLGSGMSAIPGALGGLGGLTVPSMGAAMAAPAGMAGLGGAGMGALGSGLSAIPSAIGQAGVQVPQMGGMFGGFMDKLGDIDLSQMQGLMGGQQQQQQEGPGAMPVPIPAPAPPYSGGSIADGQERAPTETYSTGPHGQAPMDPLMQMIMAQGGALQPARVPMSSTVMG